MLFGKLNGILWYLIVYSFSGFGDNVVIDIKLCSFDQLFTIVPPGYYYGKYVMSLPVVFDESTYFAKSRKAITVHSLSRR